MQPLELFNNNSQRDQAVKISDQDFRHAGQTDEMLFDWRGGETGDYSLDCEILTPTQLVSDDSFGGGAFSSETVSWIEVDEEAGLPMVSILVAIAVTIVLIGLWLIRKSSGEELMDGIESTTGRA